MNILDQINSFKINSCGISDCNKDWSWDTGERGLHDFDLWYVLRGRGCISTENQETLVGEGSGLLLFPSIRYKGTQNIRNKLLVINVHFDVPDKSILENIKQDKDCISKIITDIPYFEGMLYRIIRLYNAGKISLAENIFHSALCEYFTQDSFVSNEIQSDTSLIIKKICDNINTFPEKKHNLNDLSEEYGYSSDYLGKLFKENTNISFSEYISNARINKAKALLLGTNLSIAAVSESLGYFDPAYFTKQFTKVIGMTPKEYKNSVKKEKTE